MGSFFRNKIAFILNKHKLIKRIIFRPVLILKRIRSYPKAQYFYKRFCNEVNNRHTFKNTIWYFCVAEHPNLGDLAQRYCIENWCKQNYPDYQIIRIATLGFLRNKRSSIDIIKRNYVPEDIFVFQSGYTMSDLHPDDKVRKSIIANFPLVKTLIFPQTILYNNEKNRIYMNDILRQNKNLLLLTRDSLSYKYAKEKFPEVRTELYPDIVTTLIGKKEFLSEKRGIALCVRNDGEKYYSYEEMECLKEQLELIAPVDVTDTNSSSLKKIDFLSIEKNIWDKIKVFSQYKVIITDRYHGTIFSLIAGTPVIVIRTKDHKVSTGVKWFEGIYDDYVYYCDNLESIPLIINKIMGQKSKKKIEPYFDEQYYSKLIYKFQ